MTGGNGRGDRLPDYDTFDRLPPEVREVLRYAPVPFSAETVEASLKKHAGRGRVDMFVAYMRAVLHRRFPGHIEDRDRQGWQRGRK